MKTCTGRRNKEYFERIESNKYSKGHITFSIVLSSFLAS